MSKFIERIRRFSSGPSSEKDDVNVGSPASPRSNVWSSTFDPGRNANLRKAGSSYYDKPDAGHEKSVWEHHLDSEASRPRVAEKPSQTSAASAMNTEELRRMFSPERVEMAMKQADPTGSGRINLDTFMSSLQKTA